MREIIRTKNEMKKSKAKIIIEYKGKRYRVGNSPACNSKRACSLYERGVCDCERIAERLPCDDIANAFLTVGVSLPPTGYREVKR